MMQTCSCYVHLALNGGLTDPTLYCSECLKRARIEGANVERENLSGTKDNDGWSVFEWDFGKKQILSVRVSPDGKQVAFAALMGEESCHGMVKEQS